MIIIIMISLRVVYVGLGNISFKSWSKFFSIGKLVPFDLSHQTGVGVLCVRL